MTRRTETLRQVDGVVGVSEYVAGYVRHWVDWMLSFVPFLCWNLETTTFPITYTASAHRFRLE